MLLIANLAMRERDRFVLGGNGSGYLLKGGGHYGNKLVALRLP